MGKIRTLFENEIGLPTPDLKEQDVRDHFREMGEAKQGLSDATTANARTQKTAQKDGINTEAAKLVQKLMKQDRGKSIEFLSHVFFYARTVNMWSQLDMFLDDQEAEVRGQTDQPNAKEERPLAAVTG